MSPAFRGAIALALLGLVGGSHAALAQTTQDYGTKIVNPFFAYVTSFDTTTSASSPTFNRPGLVNVPGVTAPPTALSGGGTAVGYATHDFTPTQTATYGISTTIDSGYADPAVSPNGTDNFVQAIYVPDPTGKTATFDPTKPLTNAGLAYSQGASGDGYLVNLDASTQYTLVNTGYYNANLTGSKLSVGTVTTEIDRLDYGSTTFVPDAPDLLSAGTPVTQTLTLFGGSAITAFNSLTIVGLDHPSAGDLTATLTHDGKTVTLFDQPDNGGFGSTVAFDGTQTYKFTDTGADLSTALNDAAAGFDPLPGGVYQSFNPLSAFDGLGLAGDWTLTMTDNTYSDSGSFLGFSFNASSEGPAAVPESSTWVGLSLGCLVLAALAGRRRAVKAS